MIRVAIALTSSQGPPKVFAPIYELTRKNGEPLWKFTDRYIYMYIHKSHLTFPNIESLIEKADSRGLALLDGRGLEADRYYHYDQLNLEKVLNGDQSSHSG